MLVRDTEIFLKKKKKRGVNMVVSDIRTFQRMSIEKSFLNARNKDYMNIKHFLLYLHQVGPQSSQRFLGKYKKCVQSGIFLKKYNNFFQVNFFVFSRLGWKLPQVTALDIFHYQHNKTLFFNTIMQLFIKTGSHG